MKVEELRIGNLYDNNGNYFVVTPSTIESVFESERVWCKPIPLTEEWLIKFGFEMGKNPKIIQLFPMQLLETPNGFEYFLGYGFGGKFIVIKYLHQLQNLYFALTGEELKSKD